MPPKEKEKAVSNFFKKLGPGLITGASDDDPSGIATYSQAGAQFGFTTLWTALVTFPLMAAIQEMCARIGLVTNAGLTGTLKKHYPRWFLLTMVFFSTPAIVLNIGSDIAGMGAVMNMIIPQVHAAFFSLFFTILLIFLIIYLPYYKIAAFLKYLCLTLLVYFVVPFLAKAPFGEIIRHTLVPTIKFDKDFFGILVAILGTTISPYLFFWQATMIAEEQDEKPGKVMINKQLLEDVKTDVNTGMFFSNVVMYFIILTAAAVLFSHGVHKIDTVEQAAQALEPIAGKAAYYLFAVGVIGTGLLTIPVLSGSLSYIYSEAFGWKGSLNKTFGQAKSFYVVIILALLLGLALNYIGISPVKALYYTAVLYGITAPVMIAVVIHIANDKAIMGIYVNRRRANVMGWVTFALMTVSSFFLLYTSFK